MSEQLLIGLAVWVLGSIPVSLLMGGMIGFGAAAQPACLEGARAQAHGLRADRARGRTCDGPF
jgi:hypothetical protein